jgi:hypothetical protein
MDRRGVKKNVKVVNKALAAKKDIRKKKLIAFLA